MRQDGRVQAMATVVAVGVTSAGERQILGVDAGPCEDGPFWTAFLRSLVKRGLHGVKLVISDAHEGLRRALSTVLSRASWQRCRVHYADLPIMPTAKRKSLMGQDRRAGEVGIILAA